MNWLELLWYVFLFLGGFASGFLVGNFFGEVKAKEERYKYLAGEFK